MGVYHATKIEGSLGYLERIAVVEKAPVDAERERLRRRTHEIAEAKDAEHAAVKRELGRLKLAVDQARERTKDWKPDWTDDPPSREPYGWWRYTSHNHAMEAVALVAERNEAVAERERMLADLQATQKRATDARQDHREVLVERERLLDLLRRAGEEIGTDAEGDLWPLAQEIWGVLREYGRLGKEGS